MDAKFLQERIDYLKSVKEPGVKGILRHIENERIEARIEELELLKLHEENQSKKMWNPSDMAKVFSAIQEEVESFTCKGMNSILDEEIKAIKATYESLLKDAEDQLRKEMGKNSRCMKEIRELNRKLTRYVAAPLEEAFAKLEKTIVNPIPKPRNLKEGEYYRVKYNGLWTIARMFDSSLWDVFGEVNYISNEIIQKVGKRIKFKD